METTINPNKYSVLYKTSIVICTSKETINIPSSDIVSYGYICNYDTMTYPIFRIRIYSDLEIIQKICDDVDNIKVIISLAGNVYRMSDNSSPVPVAPATNISFDLSGYIENKNIPTSSMDQYREGIKIQNNLNENIKYPLEIYCYKYDRIHKAKNVVKSIYKNMSLDTIIRDIFSRIQNDPIEIDEIDNNNKYSQILIPNLDVIDALTYLERYYGIYKKGTQIFGDIDKTYISTIDTSFTNKPVKAFYVTSSKNNTDLSGLRKFNDNTYQMFTLSSNVSVITETDIEQVLNGSFISDINAKTGKLNIQKYDEKLKEENIMTKPNILHSYQNEFVSDMIAASVDERITRIDLSGTGYDVFTMKNNSRYNIIFESPIRGFDINRLYRASYAVHVFTNLDADLFIAESAFTLCTN